MQLAEVLQAYNGLPPDQQKTIAADAVAATKGMRGVPSPGPQTEAYMSLADVMLYGGEPGGGKTALEVLLALNEHRRSLIVRRSFVDLDGVLHTLDNVVGQPNVAKGGNRPYYETDDGRVIDFMGMGDDLGGKQGNPHDLICVDEAAQIPEVQIRMLMGWLRTDSPGQRCRVVMGSNPPLDSVGDWLIDYFAPWLDDRHPNPAEPGELRWFLPNESDDGFTECGPDDTMMLNGMLVRAQSRTFIRAHVSDNPYYDQEQYAKSLASLPKEMRERLMTGNFMASREDPQWQCIPSSWVRAAVARWREQPPMGVPMCSIGVDVAQGGTDNTVLARRHDGWFAPLIVEEGKKTPGGTDVAALVMKHRHDNAKVIVDVGGGWGGDAHGHLMKNQVDSVAYMGVKKSLKRTADMQLSLTNVRTEAYWRLREALDPDQRGGSPISLPNDKRLISDLTSPFYKIGPNGIEVEPKDQLVKRLKRSTDRGDAVVMAWWAGAKMATDWDNWPIKHGGHATRVTTNTGRKPLSARR
jgi:hypothetical protein